MNLLIRAAPPWWQAALAVVGAATLTCLVSPVMAGTSNSLMDISSDGRLLACSNRDSGTVSVVDLKTNAITREVRVGAKPEGVSALAGKSVVLTGTLDAMTREQARNRIERAGGRVVSSVSRQTDYVVVGRDPGSKAARASELDIPTS